MNLKSEKGISGVDITTGIIIFMIGSVVIFNMYATLFSLASKLKVSETIIGHLTSICEEIDYENYDEITADRVRQIILAANIPNQYTVELDTKDGGTGIDNYKDEVKKQSGQDIEDLVKKVKIRVSYTIDGQQRSYVVNKIKVKER